MHSILLTAYGTDVDFSPSHYRVMGNLSMDSDFGNIRIGSGSNSLGGSSVDGALIINVHFAMVIHHSHYFASCGMFIST